MFKSNQRYISNELTHFVGRNIKHREPFVKKEEVFQKQYSILINVLRNGLLTPHPNQQRIIPQLTQYPNVPISSNEAYYSMGICFCDIPLQDLGRHMKNYSFFGLSFDKKFIAQKGGSPIFYIAEKSIEECGLSPGNTKKGCFDQMHEVCKCFFEKIRKGELGDKYPSKPGDKFNVNFNSKTLLGDLFQIEAFLYFHVFSRMKFFDHTLEDDDKENFYFEREWRLLGSLDFGLDNVERIILPKEYSKKFREDFPNYYGQINFVE